MRQQSVSKVIATFFVLQLSVSPVLADPGGNDNGNGNAYGYGFYDHASNGLSGLQGGPLPLAGATALGQLAAAAAVATALFRRRQRRA